MDGPAEPRRYEPLALEVLRRRRPHYGSAYRNHAWRDAHTELGIKHSRTRPRRPQTNGKVERLNRTLLEEWAYKRHYTSEKARRAALPGWLHQYNHHRPHTALGNRPPITRCTNVTEQYN